MKTRKLVMLLVILGLVNSGALFADNAQFRLVESRNDLTAGGEYWMDLEIRITSGSSPRTLNSLTADIYYGPQLSEWATDPATDWGMVTPFPYVPTVSKFPGYYRVLLIGSNVNLFGNPTPPGNPEGWDVTTSWQKIVTLRWTINTATRVTTYVSNASDAAAYFDNPDNAPQGDVTDWTMDDTSPMDVPLPVELKNFKARIQDSHVVLEWVTESEARNLGFEIWRSLEEESSYELISEYKNNPELKGHGTTSEQNSYQFMDMSVLEGNTYWYKLSDVSVNGHREYHGPVAATVMAGEFNNDVIESPNDYTLYQNYPNPFNPLTTIRYILPETSPVRLSVFSSDGQLIRRLIDGLVDAGTHEVEFNSQDLSSGVYYYRIETSAYYNVKKMIYLK